jgi:hypothetical protein
MGDKGNKGSVLNTSLIAPRVGGMVGGLDESTRAMTVQCRNCIGADAEEGAKGESLLL